MTTFGTQDPYSLLGFALLCALFAYAIFQRVSPRRRSGPKLHSGSTLKIQPGQFFTATVARVIDGDTVDVSTKGRRIRIRLDAIDCPEDGQPWGDVAKYGLIKLIGGQAINLEYYGLDQLAVGGRLIAPVLSAGGQDLMVFEKSESGLRQEFVCNVLYVNLQGAYGVGG